jgi:Protein of unknown function (DUF4058)
MPIHLRENQYRGVNAHLHSYLQQHGDWSVFHGMHITHLSEALQNLLPPESGYIALPEKSLQILRDDLFTGQLKGSQSIPDIGVYKTAGTSANLSTLEMTASGAVIALTDTFLDPERVLAVAIYKQTDDDILGTLVTRIELLSPANKPPGSHHGQYIAKREETLQSGINLVEIDYLHERRSPIPIVRDYPKHEPKSYPYVILVNRPYPSVEEGKTTIFGFHVDDPIPSISIPLADDDSVILDLGAVYNYTFVSNFAFGLRIVDYEKLPKAFETYDAFDQARIRTRMEIVAESVRPPTN